MVCNIAIFGGINMKNLLTLLLLFAFVPQGLSNESNPNIIVAKADASGALKSQLKEANHNFTYSGKPIHPGCIEQFNVSLADSGPPIVRAVDVESCVTSNEFSSEYKVSEDGYIGYEYGDSDEKQYFGYKYIGKAKGGIHLLDTRYSGGGTLVAKTIFMTRFGLENYRSFDNEGKLNLDKRLILKCIGQIIRGDRDMGTIELKDNKLILGESQYRKESEVIRID